LHFHILERTVAHMSPKLQPTSPGGTVTSPETRAWYAELRRRGAEIVAERLGGAPRGPLPEIIPARRRERLEQEPLGQPA
jgi:hypothetical protein